MNQINLDRVAIARFCRENHIHKLSLFGSVLRDDFGPQSDIDVLIEFQPGCESGLLGMAAMENELSVLLGGRKVDLRTPQDLSRYFREKVTSSAQVFYAGEML